jgi:hypothetical protein
MERSNQMTNKTSAKIQKITFVCLAIAGVTVGFALANKIPPQYENCGGYSKHPS